MKRLVVKKVNMNRAKLIVVLSVTPMIRTGLALPLLPMGFTR